MRGLNDISLLLFRVHVIHNKPQKLSIINPQSCILRIIKTYCLIKPSFSSLEWRNAIFFSNPSNSLLSNAAVDAVTGCAYCY